MMIWSPGGGGSSSVNAGYDQPSYRQGHAGDISSHQHVPVPRPAPSAQQFSPDADYGGHRGQDRSPPWQARDGGGGGGTWNQSRHGPSAAASSQQRQPQQQQQQQQQQQRSRTQAQREFGNHGHPAKTSVSEYLIVTLIPVIGVPAARK